MPLFRFSENTLKELSACGYNIEFTEFRGLLVPSLSLNRKLIFIMALEDNEPVYEWQEVFQNLFSSGHTFLTIRPWQWQYQREKILSRLKTFSGENVRIFARKLRVVRIDKASAESFFDRNHPGAYAKAYCKLALYDENEIMAAALFSKGRNFDWDYKGLRSFELVRFATLSGYTVAGGLSRLLAAFHAIFNPGEIMTYHNLEHGAGRVYRQCGFKSRGYSAMIQYWLNPATGERRAWGAMNHLSALAEGFVATGSIGNARFVKEYLER